MRSEQIQRPIESVKKRQDTISFFIKSSIEGGIIKALIPLILVASNMNSSMATNWIFTGEDQDAPTLFAKVSSKLLETKISCYKTNQKEPDLTAMYATNLAKLNIWNDNLESITDMKDWDKILDQPTIFGT